MSEKKLFRTVSVALTAAAVYLFLHMYFKHEIFSNTNTCLFRKATSIPCPGCGTTRAIETLLSGNILKSIFINPYGIIVLTMIVFIPVWMSFDKIFSRNSFFHFYNWFETRISKKSVMFPILFFGLINWVWNIIKYK